LCALQGLISTRGWCSNGRGRDNARAEGECISRSRPLLHCRSALTKPVMHTKLVSKQFSATHVPENNRWSLKSVHYLDNAHQSVH